MLVWIDNILYYLNQNMNRMLYVAVGILILGLIYWLITRKLLEIMLKRAKTKKQKGHITTLINFVKYFFLILTFIIIIITVTGGSLAGLGLSAGFLTAALGWALQRPITGIAAWVMVIVKQPFEIGDRISIGSVKGEVKDISPTHITLREIGGTISAEEISGRIIVIPNAVLFEQNVINYTMQDEFILDEVITQITYESNLKKTLKICEDAARTVTKEILEEVKTKPRTVVAFAPSGVDIKLRYMTFADMRGTTASEITKEIFNVISKTKGIEIAYPHMEIVKHGKK